MTAKEVKTIQDELNSLFMTIQKIDAPMTENNVVVMNACLGSIKYVFNAVGKLKEGDNENGNADSE